MGVGRGQGVCLVLAIGHKTQCSTSSPQYRSLLNDCAGVLLVVALMACWPACLLAGQCIHRAAGGHLLPRHLSVHPSPAAERASSSNCQLWSAWQRRRRLCLPATGARGIGRRLPAAAAGMRDGGAAPHAGRSTEAAAAAAISGGAATATAAAACAIRAAAPDYASRAAEAACAGRTTTACRRESGRFGSGSSRSGWQYGWGCCCS